MSVPLKLFGATYRHGGAQWSVDIWARDWAEAEAKLGALKLTAAIDGEIVERIPANAVTLPFVRLWTEFRLWARRRGA